MQRACGSIPSAWKHLSVFPTHLRGSQAQRELLRLLDGKMSFAQKRWQARGRIQMAQNVSINSWPLQTAPLLGSVALVTGGNRGIGRATALRLAQLGAAVAICGRDAQALTATEAELKQSGSPVHSQIADVSRSADVTTLVDKTQAALGPISILINNAGIGLFGPAHEKTAAAAATSLTSVRSLAATPSLAAASIALPNGDSRAFPPAWLKTSANTASASASSVPAASPPSFLHAARKIPPRCFHQKTWPTPSK